MRTILDDPAYSDWFIKFKPNGPWINPKCDNNYNPPLCSNYFHMLEQTPGYPHGDGDCAAPNCDCGKNPCGFYLWNVSIDFMSAQGAFEPAILAERTARIYIAALCLYKWPNYFRLLSFALRQVLHPLSFVSSQLQHSSTTVVNGQTFQEWFIYSYMFNEVGQSKLVSGFFW